MEVNPQSSHISHKCFQQLNMCSLRRQKGLLCSSLKIKHPLQYGLDNRRAQRGKNITNSSTHISCSPQIFPRHWLSWKFSDCLTVWKRVWLQSTKRGTREAARVDFRGLTFLEATCLKLEELKHKAEKSKHMRDKNTIAMCVLVPKCNYMLYANWIKILFMIDPISPQHTSFL